MTLADLLSAQIRTNGPISVAEYMADCLLHPQFGYYTTRDPFGRDGDFVTAPEISQMFGELIGLSLAQCWLDQGRPDRFTLAELGPGRGTLMADLLRASQSVPGFVDAAEIVLVEASPTLRSRQADALQGFDPRWVESVMDLPHQPLFLVANEFFDALPIRQFLRDGPGWREKRVGLVDGRLSFVRGQRQPQPVLAERLLDTKDGDLVEHCPAAGPICAELGKRIAEFGGGALIIDYGDWRSLGDTFQALRQHSAVDPLAEPGRSDLTAHVDFEAIAMAAPCAHTAMTTQGAFLERLGISARAQTLARGKQGAALEAIISEHRRLTHPEEMGSLFKVIGLFSGRGSPPPGLTA